MYESLEISINDNQTLLNELRTKLPQVMRTQLNEQTQARAYFLLAMLSDDDCVHRLQASLQEQYTALLSSQTPIEQALALVTQLQKSACDNQAPFKFCLPKFIGEYPVHSGEINSKINQFNEFIETYHKDFFANDLDATALDNAYQDLLVAIQTHYMGCNINSLWQLLRAMCAWSTSPIETFLPQYSCLLSPVINADKLVEVQPIVLPTEPVPPISQPIVANKQAKGEPFTSSFDYQINEAGRIADKSIYLSIHGFALKPGGHADAIAKKIPDFLPWAQWQSNIRRQLSQLIDLPLNEEFFNWLQMVLQRLGVEFITLQKSSSECYVSPFLNHKTILNTLNEEMVFSILQEQCQQADLRFEKSYLSIISRYLIRIIQGFQYNRGEALGIGANWGGVVSDSTEAGVDAFRFNDPQWAALFRHLSLHRQGPAEAYMNARIGVNFELEALVSSFEYMTQLQPSEYANTLYIALVDNLVTSLFPEPPYFENKAYSKYRHHYVVKYTDDGMQQIDSFYQADPQGTYFKTKDGDYKQTPMFRQAGSLQVEAFPRDTGSGDCFQSLSVANPLWPLQLQYAQSSSTGVRGHLVYNPIGPDEFIPDAYYGQVIRETDNTFVPFIGVIPKNFDKQFKQVELCASFVIRMLQSSRLMSHSPAFSAYYSAIATRFLPPIENRTPPVPNRVNVEIQRKWRTLDEALNSPERTAESCHKAFFSLFKELIYSLYALTKEDADLHYYFTELTVSEDAFEPRTRATCERLIRELTTLKPLQGIKGLQQYDTILRYLSELTHFFYPKPSDEVAEAISRQAKLHVKPLLALQEIKDYFRDLSQTAANISPKVSPGLMHDALKYQGPSPSITRDYYDKRHGINFNSGYRDLDGGQIVKASTRESLLDILIKSIGALVPLIHRNKTIFSLLTQPFAQAYIAGYQSYYTQEDNKMLNAIFSGIGGFLYGTGLGLFYTLSSIPMTIYTGLLASAPEQQKANHVLAISSAPSNEPGLRVKAIMDIRDHLLQLMATANGLKQSRKQLIDLVFTHVKTIHPSFVEKEDRYKNILSETFPLNSNEWRQLFDPVISAKNNKVLQDVVNQYALQIDSVLIYALYACLTAPNCEQSPDSALKAVIEKHKLKDLQEQALTALINYYVENPEAKRKDTAKYGFHGSALARLREKERGLRKIQAWMNNALDIQWGLEVLFNHSINQYKTFLYHDTLANIVLELPDSMKEALGELLSKPGHEKQILNTYQFDESQHLDDSKKEFLLQCSICYQAISSKEKRALILNRVRMSEDNDSSLSIKTREHLKLTEFIQREWHHQLLSMDNVRAIINEIKQPLEPSYHPAINKLSRLYEAALSNCKSAKAFDEFYFAALKIKKESGIEHPINEWINVTMKVFMNLLLDDVTWTNSKKLINPLSDSRAIVHWLNHLMEHKHGVRALLAQQTEQADSFDKAAWRCQHILRALEGGDAQQHLRGTGMQKLLRIICQNNNTITTTGAQKARNVDINTLCKYSITMQHALDRVREKIPNSDCVRPIEVTFKL